ncbi:hypothetical protein A1D17_03855 [Pseudomonas fluorescens]|uniref:Uncharacterized protein n=1 Tax=Pseudomonas fluorescens TaxID=294 RepID=A0A166QQE2_PSEFL|nr:hypothetical protein A1D17_03855 [Pseudomonas fluorescens]
MPGTRCTLAGRPVARGSEPIGGWFDGVLSLADHPAAMPFSSVRHMVYFSRQPVALGSEPISDGFDGVLSLADLTQGSAGDQWTGPSRSLSSNRHAVYFSRQARGAGLEAHRWLV